MTPRKGSHLNMPRAIPAPTGIPVLEPSGKQVLPGPAQTGPLYGPLLPLTPVSGLAMTELRGSDKHSQRPQHDDDHHHGVFEEIGIKNRK